MVTPSVTKLEETRKEHNQDYDMECLHPVIQNGHWKISTTRKKIFKYLHTSIQLDKRTTLQSTEVNGSTTLKTSASSQIAGSWCTNKCKFLGSAKEGGLLLKGLSNASLSTGSCKKCHDVRYLSCQMSIHNDSARHNFASVVLRIIYFPSAWVPLWPRLQNQIPVLCSGKQQESKQELDCNYFLRQVHQFTPRDHQSVATLYDALIIHNRTLSHNSCQKHHGIKSSFSVQYRNNVHEFIR